MIRLKTMLAALTLLLPSLALAQEIPLPRPGDREFVVDLAELISPEHEQQIVQMCDVLLTEHAIPIIVVTISSMANFGFPDLRIETFTTILFDQWGVGHLEVEGHSWNRGILLLVSRDDRKARIELGADWGRQNDQVAAEIMEGKIIPAFKQGDFSGGIMAGVTALDQMARGVPIPNLREDAQSQRSAAGGQAMPGGVGGAVGGCLAGIGQMIMLPFLAIAALFSKLFGGGGRSSGGSGWGGGGGFSGGSFGGGFSGGGGATGSW